MTGGADRSNRFPCLPSFLFFKNSRLNPQGQRQSFGAGFPEIPLSHLGELREKNRYLPPEGWWDLTLSGFSPGRTHAVHTPDPRWIPQLLLPGLTLSVLMVAPSCGSRLAAPVISEIKWIQKDTTLGLRELQR